MGDTKTIACQSNDGNVMLGKPNQAACSTDVKSTMPNAHESRYATDAPTSTGMVFRILLPKHVHATTVNSATNTTTSAGQEFTSPSERNAS